MAIGENQEAIKKSSAWKSRKRLYLARWATKKLAKGKRAHVMLDGQYYELIPNSKTIVVIDGKKHKVANGTLKKLRSLLRGR
jgi:hypothetical protein